MVAVVPARAAPAVPAPPLSTLLSQLLVAFTIEFDNEFEHRMPHRTARGPAAHSGRGPWLVSMAMWVNFLQSVDDGGTPLRDLRQQELMTNLAGLQRWGYVTVLPDADDPRPDPPRRDRIVRLTPAGGRARAVWRPLTGLVEDRWRQRFGAAAIDGLRAALLAVVGEFTVILPPYLPVGSAVRRAASAWPPAAGPDTGSAGGGITDRVSLSTLLAQALLALTIEFEQESPLPLALTANVLRVLDDVGVRVRELPARTGTSKEAVAGSLTSLTGHALAVLGPDPAAPRGAVAVLTPGGVRAKEQARSHLAAVELSWRGRFGGALIDRLRGALDGVLDQRDGDRSRLATGLEPYPDGWRANPPYAALTKILLADPRAALPHYPMVSHRGGFPDGS